MELYQIRYFLSVCETLNFTHAAEACNVTQPALTRAIKKLEEELGGELFRRERSRSHLTDLGKAMMPLLQQSHDAALAAKAEAENYGKGETAPLCLGISHTVPAAVIEAVVTELSSAMPGLDLNLVRDTSAALAEKLEAGDLDFAIAVTSGDGWERESAWTLFDEPFVLIARDAKSLASALDNLPLVRRPYCENTDDFTAYLEGKGIDCGRRHMVASDADALSMAQAGLGAVVVPLSTVRSLGIEALPIEEGPRRQVSLVSVVGRRHSPAAAAFLRLMRSADWSAFQH